MIYLKSINREIYLNLVKNLNILNGLTFDSVIES